MVYLTIIPQVNVVVNGYVVTDNFQKLLHLSQRLIHLYGKPDVVFTANNEHCIHTAKAVNLMFGVHGIHVIAALHALAPDLDTETFFNNFYQQAEEQSFSHAVMVLPLLQYAKFRRQAFEIGFCRVNLADSWKNMKNGYQEHLITEDEIESEPVTSELTDVFLNSLRVEPLVL